MTKRVLGRGLDALIPRPSLSTDDGEAPAAAGARIIDVPLDRITRNPEQPRQEANPEAIQELAESIREYGVLEPILVKRQGDDFVLVAGERRVTAARKAGLATIPAVERDVEDEDLLAVALIENLQREDLNPVDEALAYKRLHDEFALTQEDIARRVGKNRATVANALRLLHLQPDILKDVARGAVTPGHARAILSVDGEDARRELWAEIKSHDLSVRAAEERARKIASRSRSPRQRAAPPANRDPHLAHLEDQLRQALGTQVRLVAAGKGGKIEVFYYGQTDLERLLDLLGVELDM